MLDVHGRFIMLDLALIFECSQLDKVFDSKRTNLYYLNVSRVTFAVNLYFTEGFYNDSILLEKGTTRAQRFNTGLLKYLVLLNWYLIME